MGITLNFSHDSPENAILTDSNGIPVYELRTETVMTRMTSFISRYNSQSGSDADEQNDSVKTEVARIRWHGARPSVKFFQGTSVESDKFFKKHGLLWR